MNTERATGRPNVLLKQVWFLSSVYLQEMPPIIGVAQWLWHAAKHENDRLILALVTIFQVEAKNEITLVKISVL